MKYALASSALLTLAAAVPQWGPGGHGGPGGNEWNGFAGVPSCLSDCFSSKSGCNAGDFSCYCSSNSITTINSCISSSTCGNSDKDGAYQAIAQFCANTGATITASPEATYSATSGGTAYPTQWTSNSVWASAVNSWKSQTTGAPFGGAGWNAAGGYGPFGRGGQGNGWGPWGNNTTGAWTTGPWTNWWGNNKCPPSTWSGWTSGPWTSAPGWTSWSSCTATTTATSVVTTTVTTGSTTGVLTSTSFGIKVADVAAATTTGSGSGAYATNYGVAGAAAGVVGVVAGAVLL